MDADLPAGDLLLCLGVDQRLLVPLVSDLAPITIRGRWLSIRDTLLAAVSLGFGLLVAHLLDTLPVENRYLIIFLIGGTLGILDMVCFGFCKEVYKTPPQKLHLRSVLSGMKSQRAFLRLTVMWTAWCFTSNLCAPYLSRYSVNEMGLSFLQMMLFSTAASSFITILIMPRWGIALDRFGCRSVMLVAGIAASLTDGFYLFSTPGNIWPVLLRNFVGAMFWCGSNLAATSMQLSTSPDDARPSYIAVFACVTSLLGTALGTLAGGGLMEAMQTAPIDRTKALIGISMVLRFSVAALLVPRLENDRDGTPRQLMQSLAAGIVRKRR